LPPDGPIGAELCDDSAKYESKTGMFAIAINEPAVAQKPFAETTDRSTHH
jgi:hypothetical protein